MKAGRFGGPIFLLGKAGPSLRLPHHFPTPANGFAGGPGVRDGAPRRGMTGGD